MTMILLDAGCWMLDAGLLSEESRRTTSLQKENVCCLCGLCAMICARK